MARTRSGLLVPGPASITRTGLALPKVSAPSFNPLTDVSWAHAYWTEGPEFAALGIADGAAVTTWPDEVGTADLTTTSGATAPKCTAVSANFGSKPSVDFGPSNDLSRFMGVDFTDVPQPWEVVAVMRCSVRSNNKHLVNGGTTTIDFETSSSVWGARTGGTFRSGGTSDTIGHLFFWRGIASTVALQLDATVVVSGGSGGSALSVLTLSNDSGRTNCSWCECVFLGISAAALSAQQRLDLRTWSQGRYATP